MSLLARVVLVLLGAAAAVAGWWRLTAYYEGRGYARAQAEARQAADDQVVRIRELQRAAELRYTVSAEARDRFIVTTVKEIHRETAHLDACLVGPAAVRVLNDAAACARSDRAAACGLEQPLRDPA